MSETLTADKYGMQEALRALGLKEINQKLPVILSSAYQEFKQDLASWASDDYIVNSAAMTELLKAVKKHLS